MTTIPNLAIIVVFYNPDPSTIEKWLQLKDFSLIIVDNSDKALGLSFPDNVCYHSLGENLGIAAAQNVGIEAAKAAKKFEYVIFFDQDSTIEVSTILALYDKTLALCKQGRPVGAFGPTLVDKESGKRFTRFYKGKVVEATYTQVIDLPSAGTVVPLAVLEAVGGLDEGLFIDAVDHEWCWRAAKKGYEILQSEELFLLHVLGSGLKTFFGLTYSIPAPIRCYYQYRNYLLLLKRSYAPLYWKWSTGAKYLFRMMYYPIVLHPVKQYYRYMLWGIFDGIRGKTGRFSH